LERKSPKFPYYFGRNVNFIDARVQLVETLRFGICGNVEDQTPHFAILKTHDNFFFMFDPIHIPESQIKWDSSNMLVLSIQ
jgi:hypothetical protein